MHTENREYESHNDLTDQLAAEAARQSQQLIEVLDTINDRVYLKDASGRVTYVNQAFLRTFSLSASDVIGRKHEDFLPQDMVGPCKAADNSVLELGKPVCLETNWRDSSGYQHWSETHKSPLRDSAGKITGIVGVSRDVTARRAAEEELKRNEAILLHAARLSSMGELSAGIAHEVNQPLFSILNYAKAIENKLLASKSGESLDFESLCKWIKQIRKEASRGGKITGRLKSFVKPVDTQSEPSDINVTVRDSIEFMSMEARDTGVTIKTELDENLPSVIINRIQIQQVLMNLLKNAIEALCDSSSTPSCIVVSSQLASNQVEISVADNGPGVLVANDMNILDPFQTTKNDGVGLGLAISNTIIEAHQGKLTYFSNDLGGATFCFTLNIAS